MGGGQGDFPGVDLPVGKEGPDAVEGDAADVGVAGAVVDKVVPEDPAAGFSQRPQAVGQFLLETIIQDGGKDGGLINDIEGPLGRIDLGCIPHQDFYGCRQSLPASSSPIFPWSAPPNFTSYNGYIFDSFIVAIYIILSYIINKINT